MRHHFPDLSIFSTQNLVSGLSKLPKHQFGALLLIITKRRKTRPSHFSMPRNYEVVKVADLCQSKKRAKLIEWKAWETYQGIRDASRQPRAEKNNSLQGEAAPQSMDVDETFWAKELVMPASKKRVRLHACPSSMNLTYFPVPTHVHWRIYPQDWLLLMLPHRFWVCSGNDYMPKLQVCSVWVEVLRLLSCTCTLQGVLPKFTPAASFS